MKSSKVAQGRKTTNFQRLWSLHWIMSASYLILFTGGAAMARMPRELFIRSPLYDFHKSIGALTMAFLTWRIFLLLRVYISKYQRRSPKFSFNWFRTLTLHTSLYVFMLAVPLSGFFFSNSYKSNNVGFFGITLPDIFPQNSDLVGLGRNMHFWFAYGFLALIILHALDQWKFVKNFWRRNFKKKKPPTPTNTSNN